MSGASAQIQQRYRDVRRQIAEICKENSRDAADVTVVAVSKTHSAAAVMAAYEAGCEDFGESRVQEWARKAPQLPRRIRWHFIGHLQRNKVKHLVDEVTLIHSLDSQALVEVLERRAASPHEVLIEVNIGGEAQKTGLAPDALETLLRRCAESPVVRPVGLMCIPPYSRDPETYRHHYRRLAELQGQSRTILGAIDRQLADDFVHLSMGMSHDFEIGVQEGATLVRVGTAIFGERAARTPQEAL